MSEQIKGPPAAAMQDEMPQFWRDAGTAASAAKQEREAERVSKDLENLAKAEVAKTQRAILQSPAGRPHARQATPEDIKLEIAMSSDDTAKISYLIDPWLPHGQVVGFFGRGETAKSSFVATLAARGSESFSSLWVSTEEPVDWIKVRHMKAGGEEASLFVYKAIVTKTDALGRATASSFNVYEHLEAAILQAQEHARGAAQAFETDERPLRLVVLDTAVALTTWGKSESPNDDASVKRLLAYLLALCEKLRVTIAIIGHSNKGKHDDLKDTVAGSAAWVNSPRQAFTHLRDKRQEYSFVACTVKSTLTGTFAAAYTTHPIHTLATRPDGRDSVLCEVRVYPVEWGFEDAMTLVDAALQRDKDAEQEEQASRKDCSVAQIISTLLHILGTGVANTDRDTVEAALGRSPSRRHWTEADQTLSAGHNVLISTGPRGKLFYTRK